MYAYLYNDENTSEKALHFVLCTVLLFFVSLSCIFVIFLVSDKSKYRLLTCVQFHYQQHPPSLSPKHQSIFYCVCYHCHLYFLSLSLTLFCVKRNLVRILY